MDILSTIGLRCSRQWEGFQSCLTASPIYSRTTLKTLAVATLTFASMTFIPHTQQLQITATIISACVGITLVITTLAFYYFEHNSKPIIAPSAISEELETSTTSSEISLETDEEFEILEEESEGSEHTIHISETSAKDLTPPPELEISVESVKVEFEISEEEIDSSSSKSEASVDDFLKRMDDYCNKLKKEEGKGEFEESRKELLTFLEDNQIYLDTKYTFKFDFDDAKKFLFLRESIKSSHENMAHKLMKIAEDTIVEWINSHPEIPLSSLGISEDNIFEYVKRDGKKILHLNLIGFSFDDDDVIKLISFCPNLISITCNSLEVRGACLAELSGHINLKSVDLRSCWNLTVTGLEELSNPSNLINLNLRYCKKLTDAGLNKLSTLINLKRLHLGSCHQITDAGLEKLSNLRNLIKLNLGYCDLITDEGLAKLSGLINLEKLDLRSCDLITDEGLAKLSGLINLEKLDLRNCSQITKEGINQFRKMCKQEINILEPSPILD